MKKEDIRLGCPPFCRFYHTPNSGQFDKTRGVLLRTLTSFFRIPGYDVEKGVAVMREYIIYEVKNAHQPFVLGRERMLEELLAVEGEESPEVRFLCHEVDPDRVMLQLKHRMGRRFPEVGREGGLLRLHHPVKGTIRIGFGDYSLTARCEGTRMLDLDLFAGLSGLSGGYFAVRGGSGECGWLKPVKFWENGVGTSRQLCGNSSI